MDDLGTSIGRNAYDAAGDLIGEVGQFYLNDETGRPEWVTIATDLFGARESFAPLHGCSVVGGNLRLAVPKQLVTHAPDVAGDGRLGQADSQALYDHYQGHLGFETNADRSY